jgi:hypothetical protein
MDINYINQLTNDLLVARLEVDGYKAEYERLLSTIPELVEIKEKLESTQTHRDALQGELLQAMQSNTLKQWKLENCSVSRATRVSCVVDPAYKKAIEKELKEGKQVMGWNLNTTEYISIRTV